MDAELVAIGRVRRAVRDLSVPGQMRVLNFVQQGLYEVENERRQAEQAALGGPQGLHNAGQAVRASHVDGKATN